MGVIEAQRLQLGDGPFGGGLFIRTAGRARAKAGGQFGHPIVSGVRLQGIVAQQRGLVFGRLRYGHRHARFYRLGAGGHRHETQGQDQARYTKLHSYSFQGLGGDLFHGRQGITRAAIGNDGLKQ